MAFPPKNSKSGSSVTRRQALKEAKEFAAEIVDNPEYRAALLRRAMAGTLPAAVEIRLLEYKFGKPTDHAVLELPTLNGEELGDMTEEQLAQRAEQLASALRGRRGLALVSRGTNKVM